LQRLNINNYQIIEGDSFTNMQNLISQIDKKTIFYIDPPFNIRQNQSDIYTKTVDFISHVPNKVVELIIVEYNTYFKMPQKIKNYTLKKNKRFGKTSLAYYACG